MRSHLIIRCRGMGDQQPRTADFLTLLRQQRHSLLVGALISINILFAFGFGTRLVCSILREAQLALIVVVFGASVLRARTGANIRRPRKSTASNNNEQKHMLHVIFFPDERNYYDRPCYTDSNINISSPILSPPMADSSESDLKPYHPDAKYQHTIEEMVNDHFQHKTDEPDNEEQPQYSPMVYLYKIKSGYLFSYNQYELGPLICKIIGLVIYLAMFMSFLWLVTLVSREIKLLLTCLAVLSIVSFILVFFVDAGSLFEDEPEHGGQSLIQCSKCRILKRETSHHCSFCERCIKRYDHHCSFFGKCIGFRNYPIFLTFMVSTVGLSAGCMASLILTIFANPS